MPRIHTFKDRSLGEHEQDSEPPGWRVSCLQQRSYCDPIVRTVYKASQEVFCRLPPPVTDRYKQNGWGIYQFAQFTHEHPPKNIEVHYGNRWPIWIDSLHFRVDFVECRKQSTEEGKIGKNYIVGVQPLYLLDVWTAVEGQERTVFSACPLLRKAHQDSQEVLQ